MIFETPGLENRNQEIERTFGELIKNPTGLEVAWKFFKERVTDPEILYEAENLADGSY